MFYLVKNTHVDKCGVSRSGSRFMATKRAERSSTQFFFPGFSYRLILIHQHKEDSPPSCENRFIETDRCLDGNHKGIGDIFPGDGRSPVRDLHESLALLREAL